MTDTKRSLTSADLDRAEKLGTKWVHEGLDTNERQEFASLAARAFAEVEKLRGEVARQKEWLLHAQHERNVLQLRMDGLKKEAREHAEALMELTE